MGEPAPWAIDRALERLNTATAEAEGRPLVYPRYSQRNSVAVVVFARAIETLRDVRDGLIGNTAIITAGGNHEQAQLAAGRLNALVERIDAMLGEYERRES